MNRRVVTLRRLALGAIAIAGCSTGDAPIEAASPDAAVSMSDPDAAAAIPGAESVARALEWSDAKLHYCQAPNHQRDYDTSCAPTCNRQDNPQWDPYRSDCSGLVSWAWKLPAPGRITTEFAPFQTDLTHTLAATDLRPGDAVNNADHVMLFEAWVSHPTKATFIEEPGCSSATPYAHELTAEVTLSGDSIDVVGYGTFTAIRYPSAP